MSGLGVRATNLRATFDLRVITPWELLNPVNILK